MEIASFIEDFVARNKEANLQSVLPALNKFQAGLIALEEVGGINGDDASDLLGAALYRFGLDYEQFSELQDA